MKSMFPAPHNPRGPGPAGAIRSDQLPLRCPKYCGLWRSFVLDLLLLSTAFEASHDHPAEQPHGRGKALLVERIQALESTPEIVVA